MRGERDLTRRARFGHMNPELLALLVFLAALAYGWVVFAKIEKME